MAGNQAVSVIIPTKGVGARGPLLRRAMESVLSQEGVVPVPLVVLNGQETDPDTESWLRNHRGIRMVRLEDASLPASLQAGREAVNTPFFSELDDDDVLLPGALARRIQALAEHPDHDAVVTNGYRFDGDQRVLHVPDMNEVARDPSRALIRLNWLLPGSWLCRSDRVDGSLLSGMPSFLECTFLAVQFATRFRTVFLADPTVVWNTDTPASASKSPEYVRSIPDALARILEMDLSAGLRSVYRQRQSDAFHDLARWNSAQGRVGDAWRAHLDSLRLPGGWRFLPYSARLLLGFFRI